MLISFYQRPQEIFRDKLQYRLGYFCQTIYGAVYKNEEPDASVHPIGDGQLHQRLVSVSQ